MTKSCDHILPKRMSCILYSPLVLVFLISSCKHSSSYSGLYLQQALTDVLSLPVKCKMVTVPDIGNKKVSYSLEASDAKWGLKVVWQPESLYRFVLWNSPVTNLSFRIRLRKRPHPWKTVEFGDIRCTYYGPYQPAATFRDGSGQSWTIVMSHEIVEYTSVHDLIANLKYYQKSEYYALDSSGTMVVARLHRDPLGNSFGLNVYYLRINGRIPSVDVLVPFLSGVINSMPERLP